MVASLTWPVTPAVALRAIASNKSSNVSQIGDWRLWLQCLRGCPRGSLLLCLYLRVCNLSIFASWVF